MAPAIRQTPVTQRRFIHTRAVVERIERFDVHRDIIGRVTCVIETAFGNATDERHLAAFEPDADGAAGTRGLAFATAAAGLAMAAGFALAQPFAAVSRPGTRFECV